MIVTPGTAAKGRPKSLAISTPAKLLTLEEARQRALTACNNIENQKYIEVSSISIYPLLRFVYLCLSHAASYVLSLSRARCIVRIPRIFV